MAEEENQGVSRLPSARVLQTLHNASVDTKTRVQTANGELGQKIADAEDKHGLHAKAFKAISKLAKMDSAALNIYLTHFDDYRAKMKLDDLAGQDAFNGETGKKAAAEEDEEEDNDKVTRFPSGGAARPN